MEYQDKKTRRRPAEQETEPPEPAQESSIEIDDILDEIDEVLEENAQEFVRSYVQKGGQ